MGRRRRRTEIALILILIYSSMVHSFAFKQLFVTDSIKHQESEHMEKHGRRYNIEGRHGYTNGIPIHDIAITRGGGRGGGGGGRGGGNGAGGIHDRNYMKFIAAAVSISVAYLCGLI
ncbi:uncharacterized protein LOC103489385 [Cucumis melo]|uniref:Uncharacterized protein LOC103489385 n=1 Tax=Cucumis melo TaxID=3656 RepID=A0A1S3BFU5_CUCME|nr:uncharacterized protein LOC103489385 [Cucumis melo]